MENQQVADMSLGKMWSTLGKIIFIGYVNDMILNKYCNMMVQSPTFVAGHRNSFSINSLLFTDQNVLWTMLMLLLTVLEHL